MNQTVIASSGRRALEQIPRQRFELMLSDIRMPDLDGPGLYHALSEAYPDMQQRLIFVTGDTLQNPDTLTLGQKVPMIKKRFEPAEIIRVVAAQMAKIGNS